MDSVQHRLFQKLSCCQDEEEMWTGLLAWCLWKFFPTYPRLPALTTGSDIILWGSASYPSGQSPGTLSAEQETFEVLGWNPRQLLSARVTQAY